MTSYLRIAEEALKDPARWPYLCFAIIDPEWAYAPKIEWLVHEPDGSVRAEHNYEQVFRADTAEQVLDLIEAALNGVQSPAFKSDPVNVRGFMGGISFYLDFRKPTPDDLVRLKVHRDLVHQDGTDWMAEVSVMVIEGGRLTEPERIMYTTHGGRPAVHHEPVYNSGASHLTKVVNAHASYRDEIKKADARLNQRLQELRESNDQPVGRPHNASQILAAATANDGTIYQAFRSGDRYEFWRCKDPFGNALWERLA